MQNTLRRRVHCCRRNFFSVPYTARKVEKYPGHNGCGTANCPLYNDQSLFPRNASKRGTHSLKDSPVVENRRGIRLIYGGQLVERFRPFQIAQTAVADTQLNTGKKAVTFRGDESPPAVIPNAGQRQSIPVGGLPVPLPPVKTGGRLVCSGSAQLSRMIVRDAPAPPPTRMAVPTIAVKSSRVIVEFAGRVTLI